MQTSRADYYRRQADICFRLSLAASDDEISVHLIALAQRYKAKAEALERERPTARGDSADTERALLR
jgi:hypothetical protein